MAHIDVSDLAYRIPGGRTLFEGVTFAVRDGSHAALIGPNGVGKTTLLRVLAGEVGGSGGGWSVDGVPAYMPQLVGAGADTVRDALLRTAPPALRDAAARLAAAEAAVRLPHGRSADDRYAASLAEWGDAGGYDAEVLWDICTSRALGSSFDDVRDRPVATLSGGEQKRLVLEALFRSDATVLLLDEPDNFLDVASKQALERRIASSDKTILFVSHDRELLSRAADRIVTIEGSGAWTHEGSFATYLEARAARLERLDMLHRRHAEEHARLVAIVKELKRRAAISDKFAAKAKAAESRLRRYEAQSPPPERPAEQRVRIGLEGSRSGRRAVVVEGLAVPGVFDPFDAEVEFGDRVAVVGPNGTGKSHFVRLLSGSDVGHAGSFRLGARVVPALFSQTHHREAPAAERVRDTLGAAGLDRGRAMRLLRRYELESCYDQPFETLSGGQQARLQILMLELSGANLLLLDEPTDNLDVASASALEDALSSFEGTVVAVTHDRWFLRCFDRCIVFAGDGSVREEADVSEVFAS